MNRSEEIRRFYEENPSARPKECIAALAARGIDVSPTLVSCVRAKLKVRDVAADVIVVRDFIASSGLDSEVAVEILSNFADVVDRVGGIGNFRVVLGAINPGAGGGMEDDEEEEAVADVAPAPAPVPNPESVLHSQASESFYDDVNDDEDDD